MCSNPTPILENKHLHFNLDPTLPSSCHPASLLLSGAYMSSFSSLLGPRRSGFPNKSLSLWSPVFSTLLNVQIFFVLSLLPEKPISVGLFDAVVSWPSSRFPGHLSFVPYLALSVSVPQSSLLTALLFPPTVMPSVTTCIPRLQNLYL